MNSRGAGINTQSEVEQFLNAHPDVRHVDAVTVDLCGILRGKRYPREDLSKLYKNGLALPYTVYLMDVTGDSSVPCGRGFTDCDPDGLCMPVPGTLVPVPATGIPLVSLERPNPPPAFVRVNREDEELQRVPATGHRETEGAGH